MMTKRDALRKMIEESPDGIITIEELTENRIYRGLLTEFVDEGSLERVERGIYLSKDALYDDAAILQQRYKKGIYSHETALFLHNMTTFIPDTYTMTFPGTYNATSLRDGDIEVKRCIPRLYDVGVTKVRTMFGNFVNVYDRERSICEYARGTPRDITVLKESLQSYLDSDDRDLTKLMEYSKTFHVEKKISNYLDVLI